MKKIYLFLPILLFCIACEKEIQIDLNSAAPRIVIEGEISDSIDGARVRLTKTVNFSSLSVYPPISGATVTISDNVGNIFSLLEKVDEKGVYELPTVKGVGGRVYTLQVVAEGKIYTSTCAMPLKVPLDGLRPIPNTVALQTSNSTDTTYLIRHVFQDPKGVANSYRAIQTWNGRRDNQIFVQNDNNIDGLVNQRPIFNRDFEIKKGDTVSVELQSISTAIYDYFYSLDESSGNGPGGGTTPTNPVSNLKGGALGYFSAYAVDRKEVIVK